MYSLEMVWKQTSVNYDESDWEEEHLPPRQTMKGRGGRRELLGVEKGRKKEAGRKEEGNCGNLSEEEGGEKGRRKEGGQRKGKKKKKKQA